MPGSESGGRRVLRVVSGIVDILMAIGCLVGIWIAFGERKSWIVLCCLFLGAWFVARGLDSLGWRDASSRVESGGKDGPA